MTPLNIFIGYDPKETVAYHVLAHSIMTRSSKPVTITPIIKRQLRSVHRRAEDSKASTEFSFTRFLVPYLSNYTGWSLFMDCDMLVECDINKLFNLADDRYSVMCVKHNHEPEESHKFLGNEQTQYEKKNWSSVMLMNNMKCARLHPQYVETASGLELHQFKWLDSDDDIGELPKEWNFLVGYDSKEEGKKICNYHYTSGGPYFIEYQDCDYSDKWFNERSLMLHAVQS
jgi:lipopolysaccharide biosynthesis glycosyltransferase